MSDHIAFLQQEIESATPAKLRWLLLRRATGLCQMIRQYWEAGDNSMGQQWLLQIQDILGELLNGVTDPENELAKTIVDLYVFLTKETVSLYQSANLDRLTVLSEIFQIEEETWKAYVDQENRARMIQLATQQSQIAQRVDATIDSIHDVIRQADGQPIDFEC